MKNMKIINKGVAWLCAKHFLNFIDDKAFLKIYYWACVGKPLNINNPVLFSEKIQWLKLHDRNPQYTLLVDKYEAKKYVAHIIGEEHIIPTLGVWTSFDEIDFDTLPNQFVLKCTHDSGGLVICKDKGELDLNEAKSKISKCLKKNFYWSGREWPYKNVKPRIIAEQYMEDSNVRDNAQLSASTSGLLDYKFYCFDVEPKFLYVAFANIRNGIKKDMLSFFDLNWNTTKFYRKDHEQLPFKLEKPSKFEEMLDIAKKLSRGIPFVRVDLYLLNGNVYFSELTFHPGGGFGPFYPEEWERKIGDWITLPEEH